MASSGLARAQIPVLGRSDVVFMYEAARQTYADYGATVLAWGGRPTEKSLREAEGLKFFGSVGMVTEFGRYHERFPDSYEQGLCRDLDGRPFKVPWLTDHQHGGVPFWWCCTRQPLFRRFIEERVVETVRAGAYGVHIDDHLGTAGGLFAGGCFCDRCVSEFRDYLAGLPKSELAGLGIGNPDDFDVSEAFRVWRDQKPARKVEQNPLYRHFRIYQLRGAAQFMARLRALAAQAAGRPVPMGANACLLWGPHLNDHQSLDLFSAEIQHGAERRQLNDDPLLAYRLADAVGRPLAATASGHDWAFIKEHNLPGLVQSWIALGYAAGHSLMAPHRQWCYTPEKGTHWYDGPKEKFAPLYRFVRQQAAVFDDFDNHADLTVAVAHRTLDRDARRVIGLCNKLAEANISYRLVLGGDEIVERRLSVADLGRSGPVLVVSPDDFLPADREVLAAVEPARRLESVEAALTNVRPAVRLEAPMPLRLLPRIKRGCAVLHLVNVDYDATADRVRPVRNVRLKADLHKLGVGGAQLARCFAPDREARLLPVGPDGLTVPEVGLWVVLEFRAQ